MPKALDELAREVLQLPRQQRLALAGFLLELEDASEDPNADAAWEEEIEHQLAAAGTRREN